MLVDVDNTLLDFKLCSFHSMRSACEDFSIHFEKSMFDAFYRINTGLWHEIEKGDLTVEKLFEIRWNVIFKELGVKGVDGVEFEKDFHKYLNVSAVKVEGADDALDYLSKKYEVCVASNAPARQQQERMRRAGLDKYISRYFISEELKASKPDKEFFDKAFSTLNISPNEAVMLGDSPTADVAGAKAYGLKTVFFDAENAGNIAGADFVIKKLVEIKTVL